MSPVQITEDFLNRSLFPLGSELTIQLRDGAIVSGIFHNIGNDAELIIKDDHQSIAIVSATVIDYQIDKT